VGAAPPSTSTAARTTWWPLQWDSDFFAIRIGRIELRGTDPVELARAEVDAVADGIRCLYAEVDAADVHLLDLAQRRGYRVVDVALHLTHDSSSLEHPLAAPAPVRIRPGTPEDVPRLEDHLMAIAPWSRFAADPRFGPAAAAALHRSWVRRAAEGTGGRRLLVAEDARGRPIGLSTLAVDPDHAPVAPTPAGSHRRIDLIATTRPGSGAARELVRAAFAHFGPGPSVGGPIAARNVASLRFSEQLGYRVGATRCHLHRWLDEPPTHDAPAAGPR